MHQCCKVIFDHFLHSLRARIRWPVWGRRWPTWERIVIAWSSPGSPASPFFLFSSAFLRRARQLRITYQPIAFFNVRDKRLKLPFHNTVLYDKIKGQGIFSFGKALKTNEEGRVWNMKERGKKFLIRDTYIRLKDKQLESVELKTVILRDYWLQSNDKK